MKDKKAKFIHAVFCIILYQSIGFLKIYIMGTIRRGTTDLHVNQLVLEISNEAEISEM